MYNVFYRYIKIKSVSKFVTVCAYFLLLIYYKVLRMFLAKKKNYTKIDKVALEDAEHFLNRKCTCPNTKAVINNESTNKTILLSIIMPAYNVEKYIKESVDSIINQKCRYNYELLIINDGSTDRTAEIVASYNNTNIQLINQKNQGLSGARNTGLNNAKGKYVAFIDSDDILEDGSINEMLDAIINNNADVSIGGYYLFYDDSDTKQLMPGKDMVVENNPNEIIFNPGFAWGKIYKRELFFNVRFPLGAWFEDTVICSVIYRKCKKMAKISDCVYGYRQNWGGISKQSKKSYKVLDHIWVMKDAIQQAHNNSIKDDDYLYSLCFGHFSSLMYRRIRHLDEETKIKAFIYACGIMKDLGIDSRKSNKKGVEKDIEKSFKTGNYKLWKLASFVV